MKKEYWIMPKNELGENQVVENQPYNTNGVKKIEIEIKPRTDASDGDYYQIKNRGEKKYHIYNIIRAIAHSQATTDDIIF